MICSNDLIEKENLQQKLRSSIQPGAIDVNIMAKVDKTNYAKDGSSLEKEFSDALSSLRGFALSDLDSSVVFSAGYNARLYSYIESFDDFYPDLNGYIKKKIILKVSDFRSAVIQGKILAKKGLWISEFRIESGLNCGGHAFATTGLLLGPILEEFKKTRSSLEQELLSLHSHALDLKGIPAPSVFPELRITVQGGIGTNNENNFLLEHYRINGTGWGSPFLLVPEATNVDKETLLLLASAKPDDYYLSNASPLGIPFNNFKKSSAEILKQERIENNRPGSPCVEKLLVSNTEFTEKPICTASRKYQHLKLKELGMKDLPPLEFKKQFKNITDKICLCVGLSSSALIKNKIDPKHKLHAVAICPGPNLAYFSGIFTLKQMVDHIYGKTNILNSVKRPNIFINELRLYVDYLKNEVDLSMDNLNSNKIKYLNAFKSNLLSGINYYRDLKFNFASEIRKIPKLKILSVNGISDGDSTSCLITLTHSKISKEIKKDQQEEFKDIMISQLNRFETIIKNMIIPATI
ncbi:hypothetical protein BH10BAC5_BH10BAC5_03700 [soil metagenome]